MTSVGIALSVSPSDIEKLDKDINDALVQMEKFDLLVNTSQLQQANDSNTMELSGQIYREVVQLRLLLYDVQDVMVFREDFLDHYDELSFDSIASKLRTLLTFDEKCFACMNQRRRNMIPVVLQIESGNKLNDHSQKYSDVELNSIETLVYLEKMKMIDQKYKALQIEQGQVAKEVNEILRTKDKNKAKKILKKYEEVNMKGNKVLVEDCCVLCDAYIRLYLKVLVENK